MPRITFNFNNAARFYEMQARHYGVFTVGLPVNEIRVIVRDAIKNEWRERIRTQERRVAVTTAITAYDNSSVDEEIT